MSIKNSLIWTSRSRELWHVLCLASSDSPSRLGRTLILDSTDLKCVCVYPVCYWGPRTVSGGNVGLRVHINGRMISALNNPWLCNHQKEHTIVNCWYAPPPQNGLVQVTNCTLFVCLAWATGDEYMAPHHNYAHVYAPRWLELPWLEALVPLRHL